MDFSQLSEQTSAEKKQKPTENTGFCHLKNTTNINSYDVILC